MSGVMPTFREPGRPARGTVSTRPYEGEPISIRGNGGGLIVFERAWNVFRDGKRIPGLFVGQSTDGKMYGCDDGEIIIITGPREASRVAWSLVKRVKP